MMTMPELGLFDSIPRFYRRSGMPITLIALGVTALSLVFSWLFYGNLDIAANLAFVSDNWYFGPWSLLTYRRNRTLCDLHFFCQVTLLRRNLTTNEGDEPAVGADVGEGAVEVWPGSRQWTSTGAWSFRAVVHARSHYGLRFAIVPIHVEEVISV